MTSSLAKMNLQHCRFTELKPLVKCLPDKAFVIYSKRYRTYQGPVSPSNPLSNTYKLVIDFSECDRVTYSIQKWFLDLSFNSEEYGLIEYTRTNGTSATVITSF